VEFVVVVAIVHSRLALAFHLTCSFQSNVTCKFEARCSCQTRNPFGGEGVLYVRRRLANPRSLLYQCKHIQRCELVAAVQNDKSTKDDGLARFHWIKIFIPNSMKIDRKYVNVWLEDVPNLFSRELRN